MTSIYEIDEICSASPSASSEGATISPCDDIEFSLTALVTSLATFSSRLLGVISSAEIKETSKLFRYFNCLAYSTLAALIARTIIFPVGVLSDASYLSRATVVLFCLFIFFISKRNFVYPTVISAIMMALLSWYL